MLKVVAIIETYPSVLIQFETHHNARLKGQITVSYNDFINNKKSLEQFIEDQIKYEIAL